MSLLQFKKELTCYFISFQVPPISSLVHTCFIQNFSIEFTLSPASVSHTASNINTNCFLSQCTINNDSNTCRQSQTPCFDYRTHNNRAYCAPASLCMFIK